MRDSQQSRTYTPTRMFMVGDFSVHEAHDLAVEAVQIARSNMPKFTGASSRELTPYYGEGFFGIQWVSPSIWYQEVGIRPFTMRALAGKTIPMWVKDPTGEERRKSPRAETKIGEDGEVRVLVFRRAAKQGARKTVVRGGVRVSVPQSYPGAPGRISVREAAAPYTRAGKIGGRIAGGSGGMGGNVGVRWRHPGLTGRSYLHRGMVQAAVAAGIDPNTPVHVTDETWGA